MLKKRIISRLDIKTNSIILIFTFFVFKLNGQSLSGTSGILNVPSARILNDGDLKKITGNINLKLR
jgi:hypothetical protein